MLLEKKPGIRVIAEAGDGCEALELIGKHLPDVVLMDVAMPGLNGLEALARITTQYPTVKVLMLSMHANEEYVWQALSAGAAGYLLKGSAVDELVKAIKAVSDGERYLSPLISESVIETYLGRVGLYRRPLETLTQRQREILQLIAEGESTKEIAFRLEICVKTVEAHRAQLMKRLNIHEVAGLVRYAIKFGMISP
jgi:DNA-binding NarL/FixJ family response regulator